MHTYNIIYIYIYITDHEPLILPTWDDETSVKRLLNLFWKAFLENPRFLEKPEVFIKQVGKPEVLVYVRQIRRIEFP